MKKILVLICTLLIITSCVVKEEQTQTSTKLISKRDESKEYFYVKSNDEYDLMKIIAESGRTNDFDFINDATITFFSEGIPNFDTKRAMMNEKIVVNLDSYDAGQIEERLNKKFSDNQTTRARADFQIRGNDTFFPWSTQYLYSSNESKLTLSLTVYNFAGAFPGEGYTSLASYVFSKEDGKLLSNQEVLEKTGVDNNKLNDAIKKDFVENKYESGGQIYNRILVSTIEQVKQEDHENLYIRIKEENGIDITDNDLYVILETYSALHGDFTSPKVFQIPIKEVE
ncbi:hypothetical protein G7059_08965 [Erysipelothrix sp. HDW6A]|uniref:hypothetical protein n=1 Tax=Erysipelothrix sp. HDW6A TaxID=2714928 RepID=UPI00140DA898|nr:hypothetical protein [Erysipelothrix sp. HDW6A]QIK57964.1 hypothetical protein G7059_08965 [Erysipelothrix sp. HDW6A]